MEITPKIAFVEGSFETKDAKLICVANEKHGTVNICVKCGNWNVPIGCIKLYSDDLYSDFIATLADAKMLGDEICRRWNEFPQQGKQ